MLYICIIMYIKQEIFIAFIVLRSSLCMPESTIYVFHDKPKICGKLLSL